MVYLFLAQGFEEIEALACVDILRRAGVSVTTVGIGSTSVTGAHGITVSADTDESEAEKMLSREAPEMIVLPGGMPGADNLNNSKTVSEFISVCRDSGSFICAICAAPYILGVKGLLKGRMSTCYPGFEDRLEGAQYYDCDVIRDGEFITGRGPGVAVDFALELVSALKGEECAEELRGSMQA